MNESHQSLLAAARQGIQQSKAPCMLSWGSAEVTHQSRLSQREEVSTTAQRQFPAVIYFYSSPTLKSGASPYKYNDPAGGLTTDRSSYNRTNRRQSVEEDAKNCSLCCGLSMVEEDEWRWGWVMMMTGVPCHRREWMNDSKWRWAKSTRVQFLILALTLAIEYHRRSLYFCTQHFPLFSLACSLRDSLVGSL